MSPETLRETALCGVWAVLTNDGMDGYEAADKAWGTANAALDATTGDNPFQWAESALRWLRADPDDWTDLQAFLSERVGFDANGNRCALYHWNPSGNYWTAHDARGEWFADDMSLLRLKARVRRAERFRVICQEGLQPKVRAHFRKA